MDMSLTRQWEEECATLSRALADQTVLADRKRFSTLSRRYAKVQACLECAKKLQHIETQMSESKALADDPSSGDLSQLAREEVQRLEKEREQVSQELAALLQGTMAPDEQKNTILEIRAGTGGEEASLFAADLARMYQRYAERRGWTFALLDSSHTAIGGLKELIATIKGRGSYEALVSESGVHRVQRIPKTEKSGRIHTSTASVAVLPEVGEIDVTIDPDDLEITVARSGGAGGQNVN
ncbi:MAG: PCRF domain-containing protein, partial [Parcubacteria group bacterium]|nr:PCRF domain-containing protein [Parcubacteria group bacterium]